jgi:hypothetical protein
MNLALHESTETPETASLLLLHRTAPGGIPAAEHGGLSNKLL